MPFGAAAPQTVVNARRAGLDKYVRALLASGAHVTELKELQEFFDCFDCVLADQAPVHDVGLIEDHTLSEPELLVDSAEPEPPSSPV